MSKLIDKILFEAKTTLFERIINLFPNNTAEKEKYADEIFNLIQKAYQSIGGIAGNGFKNPQDMIDNIPFWKFTIRDGAITSVIMYKEKNGRKRVVGATDGTVRGKNDFIKLSNEEVATNRSWGEVSGAVLAVMNKRNDLSKIAIPVEKAQELMPDDILKRPPEDDPHIIKFPKLKDFFYQREIGGQWHTKLAIGTPNKKITY